MKKIILLLIGILFSTVAFSFNGHQLLEACSLVKKFQSGEATTRSELSLLWRCIGFIQGVSDQNTVLYYEIPRFTKNQTKEETAYARYKNCFCISEVTYDQMAIEVVKYLRKNMTKLQAPGIALAREALQKAYQCKKDKELGKTEASYHEVGGW